MLNYLIHEVIANENLVRRRKMYEPIHEVFYSHFYAAAFCDEFLCDKRQRKRNSTQKRRSKQTNKQIMKKRKKTLSANYFRWLSMCVYSVVFILITKSSIFLVPFTSNDVR